MRLSPPPPLDPTTNATFWPILFISFYSNNMLFIRLLTINLLGRIESNLLKVCIVCCSGSHTLQVSSMGAAAGVRSARVALDLYG